MSEAKADQNKQVVLIADDSSIVRKFVSFSLSSQNMEVITAVDGMDALEKVSQIPKLDLVIVDLNMPNMDGFEFIENFRQDEKLLQCYPCLDNKLLPMCPDQTTK